MLGARSFFLREELDISPDCDTRDFFDLNSGLFSVQSTLLFNDNPTAEW